MKSFPHFDLRRQADGYLDDLVPLVEQSLGGRLIEGEFYRTDGFIGTIFGMQIILYVSGTESGQRLFSLQGSPAKSELAEGSSIEAQEARGYDLGEWVAYLLKMGGAGLWFTPAEAIKRYGHGAEA